MNTTLEIIDSNHYRDEQKVVQFLLKTNENRFFQTHESVSKFHRSLSNGWHQNNSITNRAWWSTNVQLGIYQYQICEGTLSIGYSILFKSENIDVKWNELRYRIPGSYYFSTTKRLDNISLSELTFRWHSRMVSTSFGFKGNTSLLEGCEIPSLIHSQLTNES
jgi:hypothetical protein